MHSSLIYIQKIKPLLEWQVKFNFKRQFKFPEGISSHCIIQKQPKNPKKPQKPKKTPSIQNEEMEEDKILPSLHERCEGEILTRKMYSIIVQSDWFIENKCSYCTLTSKDQKNKLYSNTTFIAVYSCTQQHTSFNLYTIFLDNYIINNMLCSLIKWHMSHFP